MSSSSTSPPRELDVFVSFRGEDVRNNFIQYLIIWLKQEGFSYFYDDETQHAGKTIEDKIFSEIHRARVALIVLSENYANSAWCLNELVEILRWNSQPENLVVIPIFYDVEPADVKNLESKSKFGKAFQSLCEDRKNDPQIPRWKKALKEVKKISGFKWEKTGARKEPDLLDSIVQSLHEKICPSRSLNFAKNVIGADRLVEAMNELLKIGQEDVRVIGISGVEGIGKTMVARAVFKGTLREFKRSIFLDEVGEAVHNNLVDLQKELLQRLTKINERSQHGISGRYIQQIKSNLREEKILLVLDGVTEKEQREKLGVEELESFCPGSRILITTKYQDLLKDLDVDDTYNVEGLYRDEAFRLFCRCAFKREEPEEGYEELSRYLSHYAGGYPSVLQKWGSFLNKKSKEEWQKFSDELVKNSDRINSIKTLSGQIFVEYPFKVVGPCGGDRSTKPWQDKGYTGVRKIDVGFDSEGIKFITVLYDEEGRPITHGTRGGETSTRTAEIVLKDPSEYLTSVSGHTKKVSGHSILQSLTFHGNKGKLAQIGTKNYERKFSFPYTGGKIVGFHGSCNDSHLESIGAFYKPIPHTPISYSSRYFGPFGGAGDISWDSNDINGISVFYAENSIKEITFKVHEATCSEPQTTTCRGNGKDYTFKVRLETPYEYITSFSGYFENANDGRILINSLTFQTNKRILGPIGRERGNHFSSPSEAVKVLGFFGRSDDYLETIGAYSKELYPFQSVGLFGSSKESNWDDWNDHNNVRKILAEIEPVDGKFIRSIKFCYEKNGRSCPSERHGGATGKFVDPIEIDDSDEYLTSMSGYYMDEGITSLTFGTNKRTLEPIGREEGIHFSSPVTGGKIVGFYGRSDENLKAIGAYFEPVSDFYPINSIGPFRGSSGENRDGSSGETWGPRKFKDVRKIKVTHDINIHCIDFEYDNGGDQSYPVTYKGCVEGDYPKDLTITLNYPREYLTMISGYAHNGVIQSLTFYSNKGIYGPCGKKMGKYFWYPSNGTRIIGFYGTMDPNEKTLKSIGVYVEPIPRMYPFKTVGPFGGSNGTEWDDGVHTDVRGFRISFGKAIKVIGIAYDNNGSFVSGSEHGSGYNRNGSFMLGLEPGEKPKTDTYTRYKEVILDYPKERLLSISVWVEEDEKPNHPRIHDLQIFTTKDDYGPFIQDPWQKRNKLTKFHIPSQHNDGRIVGFFGRVGRYLHSIGARLEP